MATLTQPTLLDTPRPSLLDAIAAERRATAPGGPTLEDLVTGAWTALRSGEPAACLACGAALAPRYAAGHHAVGGRCSGCGSELG